MEKVKWFQTKLKSMSLKTIGTKERVSVPIPEILSDPLSSLFALQTLFNTDALVNEYESYEYLLKDNNLLCITTNNSGLFTLDVKSGYIAFFKKEGALSTPIDLSSKDIITLIKKFFNAIRGSLYCEILIKEYRVGKRREFCYRLSSEKKFIIREHLQVHCYSD